MLMTQRALTAWTIINLVAAGTFIYFASWTWLEPNLRGEEVARGGDALIWTIVALPVLAVAFVTDTVWLVLIARERRKRRVSWPAPFIVIIVATWIVALTVDRLRF